MLNLFRFKMLNLFRFKILILLLFFLNLIRPGKESNEGLKLSQMHHEYLHVKPVPMRYVFFIIIRRLICWKTLQKVINNTVFKFFNDSIFIFSYYFFVHVSNICFVFLSVPGRTACRWQECHLKWRWKIWPQVEDNYYRI